MPLAAGDAGSQTKHGRIADDLAEKIQSGHYAGGQALPSQRDLSVSYGVTLMTLRHALRQLAERGLVSQQPGRGTFVVGPRPAYSLGSLRSLSEDLRAQGHQVRTAVLSRAVRRPPGPVTEQLGLAAKASALRLERLRLLGDAPVIHQVSWIPAAYANRLQDVDFTLTSLYAALAEAGVAVFRAQERVVPGVLDPGIAAMLGQPAGVPVFLSDRVTYAVDGSAVVLDQATILGEFLEIRTVRAATSMSMQWSNTGPQPAAV